MDTEPTFLGKVKRVVGTKLFVEISPEIPSANPIIKGRVHRIGQIGSFVRLPLGFLNLYGVVSMVGASDMVPEVDLTGAPLPKGQRWLEVQLIGECYGSERFQRGVSAFPTLDDEVHVVTESDLATIYSTQGEQTIEIGTHSASEGLRAYIDLDKLVTRHAAIVGSTGSGKSNAVACIVKSLASTQFPNSRIIVIDPHGEYRSVLTGLSKVFAIGDSTDPLFVPYWMLAFDELAWFLVDRRTSTESVQDAQLREQILTMKRQKASTLKAGSISAHEITVDFPIPFSLPRLWYHFDRLEKATYSDMARTAEAIDQEGDPEKLVSAQFKAPGAGSSVPFKPSPPPIMGSYVARIFARLKDPRFDFLLSPQDYDGITKDLDDLLQTWLGHDQSITVFDLAGVPFEVIDLVVGAIARAVFEAMFWGRNLEGIGRVETRYAGFGRSSLLSSQGGSGSIYPRICESVRKTDTPRRTQIRGRRDRR